MSLALGFDGYDWLDGEAIVVAFNLSGVFNAEQLGLAQLDVDAGDRLYFSGNVQKESESVPEPSSLMLLLIGALGICFRGKSTS